MAIKQIERSDIPEIRERKEKSTSRIFAESTIQEFINSEIDSAEVIEIPKELKTAQVATQLRYVIETKCLTREIKVKTRKTRVFLEKQTTTPRVLKTPARNPKCR